MYTATLLSMLAGSALAAPTSQLFRRQENCAYAPDMDGQSTSTYILRVEPVAVATNATLSGNSTLAATNGTMNGTANAITNGTLSIADTNGTLSNTNTTLPVNSNTTTLGYLDAFSTSHALLAPERQYASEAFSAPTWNTNRKLIFWNKNDLQDYERGFNIDPAALSSPQSIADVVSTPGCGTPFVELVDKYADRGECGLAGRKLRAQTGCPAFGTANSGSSRCVEQKFFVCDNTGLQGIGEDQRAVYYGAAATAQYGPNCQEVDLVSECP